MSFLKDYGIYLHVTKGCDLGSDLVDVVKGKVKLKTRCSSDTGKNDAHDFNGVFE